MRKKSHIYTRIQAASSIFMSLMLLWLTISTPFVFDAKQKLQQSSQQPGTTNEDNADNPFAGTTEEKAPSSVNISEEYIHHTDQPEHPWFSIIRHHRDYSLSVYVAYHGELFCPPPNA